MSSEHIQSESWDTNSIIYKQTIPAQPLFKLELHEGAEILCVQLQRGVPCIWYKTKDQPSVLEKKIEERTFRVILTGQRFTTQGKRYVGTFQSEDGYFVGHLFEVIKA